MNRPANVPDWAMRDREVCWHPYTQHAVDPDPLPVVGASGAWLELADGRQVLDAISSWWACLHGHGHPRLVRAMVQQAARLDHVLFAGCTHEPAVRLAERLLAIAPAGLARVFFSDDGSTAVEIAIKAAYQTFLRRGESRRGLFVALEGGYHGDTFGAMAVGDPDPFFADFDPLMFRVARVPPCREALRRCFESHRGEVAGFILEPGVQGAAGMKIVPPGFLRDARRLCDEHDVLLIADEVMTGFGRTGRLFACQHEDVRPDLMCLSKGLAGGMLPLAATLVTETIYRAFFDSDRSRTFFHGHTFTASPIACAVALESIALLSENDLAGRFRAIGLRIEAGISRLRTSSAVKEVRRIGGIVAVELHDQTKGYLAGIGPRLREACASLPEAVLLRPLGNVVYALPPACVSTAECDRIAAALCEVCEAAARPRVRTENPAPHRNGPVKPRADRGNAPHGRS